MKTIKFRGLTKNGWVYGLLSKRPIGSIGGMVYYWGIENDRGGFDDITHNSKTLTQYIGLKDKNGVEIYEGDIVFNGLLKTEVIWKHSGFIFKDLSDFYPDEDSTTVKIIGNIYENKDLIK